MKDALYLLASLLAVVGIIIMLTGCQATIDAITMDMKHIKNTETTLTCKDVSPPQIDNVVISCRGS